MDTATLQAEAEQFRQHYARVAAEVGKVIVGQERVVEAVLTALFAGGHVLLEGVPGLGKTELVKTLARVLELNFNRIQFTPDLMPADIIGTNIISSDEEGRHHLEFRPGPVFTQLLLADEINRATPKTQSALLETMQEASVTVGGCTRQLTPPFMVLATQNPIEQEGTYPLPEAQLDRFLLKVDVPFPTRQELTEVVDRTILSPRVELAKVMDAGLVMDQRRILENVVVADPMRDFAVRMTLATHPQSEYAGDAVRQFVKWGASPRASQALLRAARVRALAEGRAHVSFADIRHFGRYVLQHRVLLNYDGQAEDLSVAELVEELVTSLPEEDPAAA
jgi:MoxR-like ATPase